MILIIFLMGVLSSCRNKSEEDSVNLVTQETWSKVTISDYSGNVVNHYENTEDLITYKEFVYTHTFCGSDDENLYYYFDGKKDEKTKQRCLRSISIETGEMKTLWQEEVASF